MSSAPIRGLVKRRQFDPARCGSRAPEELYRAVGGTGPKWNLRVGIGVAVPVTRAVRSTMTRGRVGVLRLLTALVGVLLVTACGDSPTSPSSSTSTTFLSLVSSPGDLLGNGFTQRVGLFEAVFLARVLQLADNRQAQFELRHPADIPTQQVVDISVEPPRGVRSEWSHRLLFALPVGQPLRPGTFEAPRCGPATWITPAFVSP